MTDLASLRALFAAATDARQVADMLARRATGGQLVAELDLPVATGRAMQLTHRATHLAAVLLGIPEDG